MMTASLGSAQRAEKTVARPPASKHRHCSKLGGKVKQTNLEMEDMAIGDDQSPEKRTQWPWPRGWEDLPGIHPDQVALASSPSRF